MDFEEALSALRTHVNLKNKNASPLSEPLTTAIQEECNYFSEMPQSSTWTGTSQGIAMKNDDFGSIERKQMSTMKYVHTLDADKTLSQQRRERERLQFSVARGNTPKF